MKKHYSSNMLAKYGFKQVSQWHDQYDHVRLEHNSGLTLIHIINPVSVEFNVCLATNGGRMYEDQLSVPQGTAHFTEHMICNPNAKFKSDIEARNYKMGNKSMPEISTNASTGKNVQNLIAAGHVNSSVKILKYLNWQINYPINRFAEFFEREKKIILAEEARLKPPHRDANFAFNNFIFPKNSPWIPRVIGNQESIQQVEIQSINAFWSKIYAPNQSVLCIQSGQVFSVVQWQQIYEIVKSIISKTTQGFDLINYESISTVKSLGYFHEPDRKNSLFISGVVDQRLNYSQYYESVKKDVAMKLFNRLANQHLREEKSIVYNIHATRTFLTHTQSTTFTEGEFGNGTSGLQDYLDGLHKVFTELMPQFLNTKTAQSWLTSYISNSIFPTTPTYEPNLQKSVAFNFLVSPIIEYHEKERIKVNKNFTFADFETSIDEFLQPKDLKQWMWIETYLPQDEVEEVIKASKLYKHYEA